MKLFSFKESILILLLCAGSWGLSTWLLRDDANGPQWANYGSDSTTYEDLADNLLAGKGYIHGPGRPYFGLPITGTSPTAYHNMHVLPGYPLLLAASYVAAGKMHGPYGLAFLLFVLMSFSVYGTAKLLFRSVLTLHTLWTGFVIFQILQPVFLVQLQAISRDLAATSFVAFFLFMLVLLAETPKPGIGLLFMTSIAAVAAISIRTNSFALMLPLLGGFGYLFWRKHEFIKVGMLAWTTLLVIVCLFAWGSYLKKFSGRFLLGLDQGTSLCANYAYYPLTNESANQDAPRMTHFFQQRLAEGAPIERAEADVSLEYQKIGLTFLKNNPEKIPKLVLMHVFVIFFQKDYFWLPKLAFLKFSGDGVKRYDDFREIFGRHRSLLSRIPFLAFYSGCYILYILLPALGMLLIPFFQLRALTADRAARNNAPNFLPMLSVMSFAAILFLLATCLLGVAMARYRMPVSAISYCCILGVAALTQKWRW